jgi:plasmid stability protein
MVICMQCMQIDSIAVMPNVQIRNVPEDVHRRLKVEAAQSGRSLNEYLLRRLTEIAERPTLAELAARAQARGPYEGPSMAEITQIIRNDRDSR